MGQHVWLLLATIGTELLAIAKWSKGQFPAPLPQAVKLAWAAGAALLVLYPTVQVRFPLPSPPPLLVVSFLCSQVSRLTHSLIRQFGIPSIRRYLRRQSRKTKSKAL